LQGSASVFDACLVAVESGTTVQNGVISMPRSELSGRQCIYLSLHIPLLEISHDTEAGDIVLEKARSQESNHDALDLEPSCESVSSPRIAAVCSTNRQSDRRCSAQTWAMQKQRGSAVSDTTMATQNNALKIWVR
jgi:hypothetical protein